MKDAVENDEIILDTSGTECPIPVLKARKLSQKLKDGDKVKKVSFGDTTGLKAKINDPVARRAFAKRHDCPNKNDKTKASYWSCRLPRYASQLGLGANMNTFW